jgi:hypothetical protein
VIASTANRSVTPFEARMIEVAGGTVLVVRVYESSDTPHILDDGSIFVRGIAQDRSRTRSIGLGFESDCSPRG